MPDLGKAVYTLILNTAQYTAGFDKAEATAVQATEAIGTTVNTVEGKLTMLGAAAGVMGTRVSEGMSMGAAGTEAGATKVDAAVNSMIASYGRAGVAAEALGAKMDAAAAAGAAGFTRASAKVAGLGAGMAATGKRWTHAFLPVYATIGVGAKMALDFQQQMQLVQTQAGGTAGDVKLLSKQILELAKSTAQGPNDLARGMFHLKSLGLDNATAMQVLKISAQGAMTGLANLEETTSALGGAIRTNIKGTGDYSEAMGTLNAIAGAGNMRFADLIEALGTGILPSAKSAGLSLRDVGSALALMTDENVPAAVAATRLNTALMMIASPTQKAEKSLNRVGLTASMLGHAFFEKDGLIKALQMIRLHFDSIKDPADRFRAMSNAFGGIRGAKAVMMLENNVDILQQKQEQIIRSAGKFPEDVAASAKTQANQIKMAWSSVQVTLIEIGRTATPIIVMLAKGLSQIATAFSSLPGPVRTVIVSVAMLLAAVGPVVWIFGKLFMAIKLIGTGVKFIAGVRVAMLGLSVATEATTATLAVAALGWVAFGVAMTLAVAWGISHIPILGGVIDSIGNKLGNLVADMAGIGAGDAAANAAASASSQGNASVVYKVRARYQYLKNNSHMDRDQILTAMSRDPQFAGLSSDQLATYSQGQLTSPVGPEQATKSKTSFKPIVAKKKPKSYGLLPLQMQIDEAVAQRQGVKSQVAVLNREQAYLSNLLAHTKNKGKQLEIQQQLSSIYSQLQGFKKTKTGSAGDLIPQKLQLAEAHAERTNNKKALAKALKAEENYLRDLLGNHKLSLEKKIAIEKELKSVLDKRKSVMAAINNDLHMSDKQMQAYVDARGSFFSEFASSVFHGGPGGLAMGALELNGKSGDTNGSGMTYNQHNNFHEIPEDRYKLSRQMQAAAASAT